MWQDAAEKATLSARTGSQRIGHGWRVGHDLESVAGSCFFAIPWPQGKRSRFVQVYKRCAAFCNQIL